MNIPRGSNCMEKVEGAGGGEGARKTIGLAIAEQSAKRPARDTLRVTHISLMISRGDVSDEEGETRGLAPRLIPRRPIRKNSL